MIAWDVVSVKADGPLSLRVQFRDGTAGMVRFETSALRGVLASLRDPRVFEQVFLDDGVVSWPGDIDIAPDAMHDEIRDKGEWVIA